MDVDDVELVVAKRSARRDHPARGERGEVGDRAVGGEAHGAPERLQVFGQLTRLRRSTMEHAAEPVRGVEGSQDTYVMASAEELLGESLNVPIHAPLVGPGIWRDKSDPHESHRVVDRSAPPRGPVGRDSAQA
jgi:hypothetical protein